MALKTYLTILKTGIYLSFLSVFLVFKNLLFPYITSKQFYFNWNTKHPVPHFAGRGAFC